MAGNYRFELLCTGTALVDSIIKGLDPNPINASGYRAESGSLQAGGEAVNEAVAAAKLGTQTGILCHLGRDAAGSMVELALKQHGVDTGAVVWDAENATPVSTLLVRADGSRRSITNSAHKYNFHPEQYGKVLSSARVVTLGSLFRAPYNDPEVLSQTLAAAGDALILADTKLPNFRQLTLEDVKDSLRRVDYIFPNEEEARYYTGQEEPEAMADVLLGYGVRNVVVKLGGRGCLLKNARETIRVEALPVNCIDATGAGDTFLAAFASELLRGAGHEEALCFANACGALCCTAIGATAGLRDRAQVEALLHR